MPDVLLILSLGPVQGFLAEARRAQDLWAGSRWLSDMTRKAIKACQQARAEVIYPADPDWPSLPNKFVVRLPETTLEQAVKEAKEAAQAELERRAQDAQRFLQITGVPTDQVWDAIWQRQLENHLEFFWAAARENGSYQSAYQQASRAFDAAKRTRTFRQVHEEGRKDSLSGRRSALHTARLDARTYWRAVAGSGYVTPAQLKPEGRERLDALGAAKRFGFGKQAEYFPSVSTIAVADFLARARPVLEPYTRTLVSIPRLHKVGDDVGWPYDGDLLFIETLEPGRLQDAYGFDKADLVRHAPQLEMACQSLRGIYGLVGKPSPYYAILVMDGDSMGEHIAACTSGNEHATLSHQLASFASKAKEVIEQQHKGRAVYTGGDDVLALLPLSQALPAAQSLAAIFTKAVAGCTASAGMAMVHHLYPLDAALQAAREAERQAKSLPGKNAVCVHALKRSGEPSEVRSRWDGLGTLFDELCRWFADGALSSRFAYEAATNLPPLAGELACSELKRLIRRHRDERKPDLPEPEKLAGRLAAWARSLSGGAEELSKWILLARFVAQGGGE
jgi:CRISPR-associated protein Cmr2